MTREEITLLFVEMDKDIQQAARKWLKQRDAGSVEDAIHDALILVMDMAFAGPEEARKGIISAVEQSAFRHFQQRREWDARHPDSQGWFRGGRHLANLPVERRGEQPPERPIENISDDREAVDEALIRGECEEAIAALARRLGQDPSWRGELYQLLYVEGKQPQEAAVILGISHDAAKRRAKRLREYLQGTREGKRALKAKGVE